MTSTRYYSLDIIKILATIGIMFHHYQQVFHVEYSVINFYDGTFNCGYLVELFFLISGFLAYSSIMSRPKPLIRDFIHRAVRIYPMAMISCAIYLGIWLLYEKFFGESIFLTENHDFWNIIRSFLLIPQPPGQLALNNPTWYLAILIQCFILLEVCRYLWQRYFFLVKWLPVMVVILCTIAKLTHMPCEIFYTMYCRGIIPFFIGIILYQLLHMKDKYSSIINLLFCTLLLGTVLAFCIKSEWSIAHQQLLLMFGIYPTLVYYLLNMKRIINISYIYIYITYASAVSFSVYLLHVPIYSCVVFAQQYFSFDVPHTAIFMVAISILIGMISVASYEFMEKNIVGYMKKKGI